MWRREGQRHSLAPSLTDMRVADTEGETLRGEVDGAQRFPPLPEATVTLDAAQSSFLVH